MDFLERKVAEGAPVFLWVKLTDEVLIPEVDKRLAAAGGKYKIEWTKAWGGTLLKLGSESKGVADGVADLAIVSTIFEAPKFPLQNVSHYTPIAGTAFCSSATVLLISPTSSVPKGV